MLVQDLYGTGFTDSEHVRVNEASLIPGRFYDTSGRKFQESKRELVRIHNELAMSYGSSSGCNEWF